MQIILLHPRFTQAKSLTLSSKHLVVVFILLVCSLFVTAFFLLYVMLAWAPASRLPVLNGMLASVAQEASGQESRQTKENLAVMTAKLGEMQAQMMRLDALGERVQGLAGVKPEEFNFKEKPGRGGVELQSRDGRDFSLRDAQKLMDQLAKDISQRTDYMNVVESALLGLKIRTRMLPTIQPVKGSYNASGFGVRFDPFTGRRSVHEGIDFPASNGTPIVAAAGGVVIAAEYHHEYGNMLEIDHGNDIMTRYAHAARLHANVGDIIKRGQHIADVGSTGRSTGAHLHFEVRVKGMPQDPHKFLSAGASQAKAVQLAE